MELSVGEVSNLLHLCSDYFAILNEGCQKVCDSLVRQLCNRGANRTQFLDCYRLVNLNKRSNNVSLEAIILNLCLCGLARSGFLLIQKLNFVLDESYHVLILSYCGNLKHFIVHFSLRHTRHLFLFLCFVFSLSYVFIITYFFYFVKSFFYFFYFVFVGLAPYTTWLIAFLLAPYIHPNMGLKS